MIDCWLFDNFEHLVWTETNHNVALSSLISDVHEWNFNVYFTILVSSNANKKVIFTNKKKHFNFDHNRYPHRKPPGDFTVQSISLVWMKMRPLFILPLLFFWWASIAMITSNIDICLRYKMYKHILLNSNEKIVKSKSNDP